MIERTLRRQLFQLGFHLSIAICGTAMLVWGQDLKSQAPQTPSQETGQPAAESAVEIVRPNVKARSGLKRPPLTAWQRQANQMLATSRSLSEQSFDAFQRGLLPLEDHLEQLDAVLTAELSSVTDEKQIPTAYQNHERHLNRALQALKDFNQPNAIGWKSDVLLAETMVAQTQLWLADASGRKSAREAAAVRSVELATRHLEQRKLDFEIGHATVPMVVNGQVVLVELAQNNRFTPPDANQFLQDSLVFTRIWSARKAGIGRDDRVALAEYQQAQFNLQSTLLDPKRVREAKQEAARAEAAATRLFESQWEFAQKGTSSLFDVASAWRLRRRLHDLLESADQKVQRDSATRRDVDLARLQEQANAMTDRRGRLAADATFVSLLTSDSEFRQAVAAAEKK